MSLLPLYNAKGASDKLLRICVAALLKEMPTARYSNDDFVKALNCYKKSCIEVI